MSSEEEVHDVERNNNEGSKAAPKRRKRARKEESLSSAHVSSSSSSSSSSSDAPSDVSGEGSVVDEAPREEGGDGDAQSASEGERVVVTAGASAWKKLLNKLQKRGSGHGRDDDDDDDDDDKLPVSDSSWKFKQTLRSGKPPELFCRQCSSLLPTADASKSSVKCEVCKLPTSISVVADRVLVSHWKAATVVEREQEEANMATIDKDCPNPSGCSSKVLSYYNKQLRSADEGQTTFYECKQCGWKWNENS